MALTWITDKDLKAIENTDGVVDAVGYLLKTVKIEFNDVPRYLEELQRFEEASRNSKLMVGSYRGAA